MFEKEKIKVVKKYYLSDLPQEIKNLVERFADKADDCSDACLTSDKNSDYKMLWVGCDEFLEDLQIGRDEDFTAEEYKALETFFDEASDLGINIIEL